MAIPKAQLRLEWIYGYRGYQCRNNVHQLQNGSLAYFVAGVGVIWHPDNGKTQKFYRCHTDDIICLALHPDQKTLASGQVGENPQICVWDSTTLQTISILHGHHSLGVSAVNFGGPDGRLLVSADLSDDHVICVWDWRKGTMLAHTKGHSERLFDVQLNTYASNVVVSAGVRHIKFWTASGNSLDGKLGAVQKGELSTYMCLAFGPNNITYAGTINGDVTKWEGNIPVASINAHSGAVFTIDTRQSGYATGGKDGIVRLWDSSFSPLSTIDLLTTTLSYLGEIQIRSVCWRDKSILIGTKDNDIIDISLDNPMEPRMLMDGHGDGELWGLAVHPTKPLFATASADKTARLWSLTDREMLVRKDLPSIARSIAFSPDGSRVAVGMDSGACMIANATDLNMLKTLENAAHSSAISEVKYSPDGKYIVFGCSDGTLHVYDAGALTKTTSLSSAKGFIAHLDFTTDSKVMKVCTGDGAILYLQLPSLKPATVADEATLTIAQWTSPLGPSINGIWGKYADTNDVNSVDVANNVAVSGDDFGKVKLFSYPSPKKSAQYREYIGHSAHVTCVRFSADKTRLITIGGADNAIFQWRFYPQGGQPPADVPSDDEDHTINLSSADELDSDIEREKNKDYSRDVYKEDMANKKPISLPGASRAKPPADGLLLTYVHGYRGYDCRNNVFVLPTGELVYHVAAVGIVFDPSNNTQSFYDLHTDDILCLALNAQKGVVATGQIGRDAVIHIWNASTKATVSILSGGHERGVCAVDFSADGKRLASVGLDDDHMVVVWDWAKGTKLSTTRGNKDKIFLIKWNPGKENELALIGIKLIKFLTVAGGGMTAKRGIFGDKGSLDSMTSLTFAHDGSARSGAANGLIYIWKDASLSSTVPAHTGPVFALDCVERGYLSGGKDGVIILWDEGLNALKKYDISKTTVARDSLPLLSDKPPIRAAVLGQGGIFVGTVNGEILRVAKTGSVNVLVQGHCEGELWGLAAHPNQPMFASASDDKTLRLWGTDKHRPIAVRKLKKAARSVAFSSDGKHIAVGMKDGSFVVYQTDTFAEVIKVQHRKEEISDMKFSPNAKYLAVGSHDNFVDIYDVRSDKRVGTCKGASSYITHIDWDVEGKLIMINTGAREILFFEAPSGTRQPLSKEVIEKISWHTWTCVLGEKAHGIWPPSSDVTDVNAACLNRTGAVLATADDFGFVKLFAFPSLTPHAKFKKYLGHSAHVTNVRWMAGDKFLVSAGGADTSLMVWEYGGAANGGETNRSQKASAPGNSDDSGTDDEEAGFDSDVDREKRTDYGSKTYQTNIRETSGIKPADRPVVPKVGRNATQSARINQGSAAAKSARPITGLQLDFIHGYRGNDTRDNLRYLSENLIVYHAAATAVIMDLTSRKQTFYLDHTDDILCLALNPNSKFSTVVATGQLGNTPQINIWDTHNRKTLSTIRGYFEKGIASLSFSANGRFLAGVDLADSTKLGVYTWASGLTASVVAHTGRVFVVQFRPDSDTQLVTCGIKHIKFWTLAGSQLLSKRPIYGRDVKAQTMLSVAFGGPGITYSGSISGGIFVWKDNQLMTIIGSEQGGHVGPVFSLFTYISSKGPTVLSGGKDGVVKVWDVDMKRHKDFPVSTEHRVRSVCRGSGNKIIVGLSNNGIVEIQGEKVVEVLSGHSDGELWGLAVHPSAPMFATGGGDHSVKVWDLEHSRRLRTAELEASVHSVDFSQDGKLIAVGLANGTVVILDSTDLSIKKSIRDRKACIEVLRFSPDGSLLAVGSDESVIDFYKVSDLSRVNYTKGLTGSPTHIDWSVDSKAVQVDTTSYERLVLKAPEGTKIDGKEQTKLNWSSFTSVLGEEVVGVWPKGSDKADVNCTSLSRSGTAIVTGDDFGLVKLFDFPVAQKFSRFQQYPGHSEHVTSIRFSFDDKYVISTGGDDNCVFVWEVLHEK